MSNTSKQTGYRLYSFQVERDFCNENEYNVKISFNNEKWDSFTLHLPKKEASEITSIISSLVCDAAQEMRDQILKSFG